MTQDRHSSRGEAFPTRAQIDAWHDEAMANGSKTAINRLHDVAARALATLSEIVPTPKGAVKVENVGKDAMMIRFDSAASRNAFFDKAFPNE